MIFCRPVDLLALERIAATNWRAFPPRLPMQPIFYAVLNEVYYGAEFGEEVDAQNNLPLF